ncbi:MAG: hypothetical protein ACLTA5_08070 [Anaerococcus obesiensis]
MSVDFLLIYRAKNGDSDAFEIIIRNIMEIYLTIANIMLWI